MQPVHSTQSDVHAFAHPNGQPAYAVQPHEQSMYMQQQQQQPMSAQASYHPSAPGQPPYAPQQITYATQVRDVHSQCFRIRILCDVLEALRRINRDPMGIQLFPTMSPSRPLFSYVSYLLIRIRNFKFCLTHE